MSRRALQTAQVLRSIFRPSNPHLSPIRLLPHSFVNFQPSVPSRNWFSGKGKKVEDAVPNDQSTKTKAQPPESPSEEVNPEGVDTLADTAKVLVLEEELKLKEAAVQELTDNVAQWKELALRERADAENARRIAKEDVVKERNFAIAKFAKDLLEVIDVLHKAFEIAHKEKLDQKEESRGFFEGIKQTEQMLLKVLGRYGVEKQEITEEKTLFDPNLHEAVGLVPDPKLPHNTVKFCCFSGFNIKDRVLRAAKVLVVDNPTQPPGQEQVADTKPQ